MKDNQSKFVRGTSSPIRIKTSQTSKKLQIFNLNKFKNNQKLVIGKPTNLNGQTSRKPIEQQLPITITRNARQPIFGIDWMGKLKFKFQAVNES